MGALSNAIRRAAEVHTRLEDFALITHEVSPARVRCHLPARYELEVHRDAAGLGMAFVSVGCFLNRDFRPSALPIPGLDFHQCTFRTYVRHRGRAGVYFFASWLSSRVAFALQRLVARPVAPARFSVETEHDVGGYESYRASIVPPAPEEAVRFELRARAKPLDWKKAQSLTYWLHGFMSSSLGFQEDLVVRHAPMTPWEGELVSGSFGFWEKLGVLEPGQGVPAYSVLVQPAIDFMLYPPVPARLLKKQN
jgi:uncharacterized protein YqjF (DUF2071 family)